MTAPFARRANLAGRDGLDQPNSRPDLGFVVARMGNGAGKSHRYQEATP
jgi:hypothetical protein